MRWHLYLREPQRSHSNDKFSVWQTGVNATAQQLSAEYTKQKDESQFQIKIYFS